MTKTTKLKPQYAWDNPEVPHRGWTEEGVDDLETPAHTCEMCGKEEIRFVHNMTHPDYHTTLLVGEICAIRMTDDYTGPKDSLRAAKNLNNNKQSWFANSKWEDYKTSSYRMTRTMNAVVEAARGHVWSWRLWAVNGAGDSGYAFSRADAQQRAESAVRKTQTKKTKK